MLRASGVVRTLYHAKASELLLYGRALGLSHSEAEDVLQETFLALMQRPDAPTKAGALLRAKLSQPGLNYRRGLWRRLTRELESRGWFERSPSESPEERQAMRSLAELPREQREVIVLKICMNILSGNRSNCLNYRRTPQRSLSFMACKSSKPA